MIASTSPPDGKRRRGKIISANLYGHSNFTGPLTSPPVELNHRLYVLEGFMVIYNLLCAKKHQFEGWFPSFEEYQKQAEKKQISCPTCGTTRVEKLLHACAVHVKKEQPATEKKSPQSPPSKPPTPAEFNEMLIRVHHYVKENFEDVGTRFAEEARQIHHGKSEERPIHGTATPEERSELADEGIPFVTLPKPELDS